MGREFKSLKEAVEFAFYNGSDCFGETVASVEDTITKEELSDKAIVLTSGLPIILDKSELPANYQMRVKFDDGGCAGVGVYVKNNKMDIVSGHTVVKDYPLTDEMLAELKTAKVHKW